MVSWHSKLPRGIVYILLMLKFPPRLAERKQTAFKEDDDGWMSGIASQVVSRIIPFWSGGNSTKMCDLDLLGLHRGPILLDVRVVGVSFLGACCARRGLAA